MLISRKSVEWQPRWFVWSGRQTDRQTRESYWALFAITRTFLENKMHCCLESPSIKESVGCKNVKWSRYRPGVAQRVGRGIALLFHDRGTRRGWVVSSTPRPHFTPGKDPVPILQEAGWAPRPVWTGGKSRPHRDSIPDLPARSQSLYRLSYRAHCLLVVINI